VPDGDLQENRGQRPRILSRLVGLIDRAPENVQERHLRASILTLLSEKERSETILLAIGISRDLKERYSSHSWVQLSSPSSTYSTRSLRSYCF
jgi:hypothetical protein